jgi:hypothetical protein
MSSKSDNGAGNVSSRKPVWEGANFNPNSSGSGDMGMEEL